MNFPAKKNGAPLNGEILPPPQTRVRYSPELFDKICHLISVGKSVNQICKMDGMPTREGFYGWMFGAHRVELADKYARACQDRLAVWAEEIVEISDGVEHDYTMPNGEVITLPEVVNRSRLRVDSRKWVLSKLMPHKYGDVINHHVWAPQIQKEQKDAAVKAALRADQEQEEGS